MIDPSAQRSFLEDLDARQDEVLRQLDELNGRVEKLLHEQTANLRAFPGEGASDAA